MEKMQRQYCDELRKLKVSAARIDAHQGLSFLPLQLTIRYTRLYLAPDLIRYSDAETSIILKAQLDLWPTANKLHSIMPTKVSSPMCIHCRLARETVSHLLSLPQNGSALSPFSQQSDVLDQVAMANASQNSRPRSSVTGSHPEPLASLATQRHNHIVTALANTLRTQLPQNDMYGCIVEEMSPATIALHCTPRDRRGVPNVSSAHEPGPASVVTTTCGADSTQCHDDRLRELRAALEKVLAREFADNPDAKARSSCNGLVGLAHTKPDLVAVFERFVPNAQQKPKHTESDGKHGTGRTPKGHWERHAYIVDVVCTADEYALGEQDIGYATLRKSATLRQFDEMGWNCVDREHGTISVTREGSSAPTNVHCRYSPYISKLKKYRPMALFLREQLHLSSCSVLPLVFGVRGFVPSATITNLRTLLSPRADLATGGLVRTLMHRLMHIIFSTIIKIYRSWKQLVPPRT